MTTNPFEKVPNLAKRPQMIPRLPDESFWETYDRIAPVAIAYRKGARFFVQEINSSRRLLKTFWRLGRQGIQIRGLMSGLGSATPTSTAALNCYLHHFFSRQSLNRLRAGQLHRFTWHDIQRAVPIDWQR